MDDLGRQAVVDQLTQRELEILRLIADGLSNQAIAERLFISPGTVKWYLKQIYGKLHVGSRTQAIAAARASGLLDGTPAKVLVSTSLHNLPRQTAPFIGRDSELGRIASHLSDPACQLLTLVGPGGIGKTRLALQAAAQRLPDFKQGVYFVDLVPVSTAENILPVLADTIHYQFQQDNRSPKQQLLDYLREKEMLLVIDNFEHVLAGASLAAEILQTAAGVKIMVTSRERLSLSNETVFLMDGLDFPPIGTSDDFMDYSAVKLFVQNVRRDQADFGLQGDDLRDIGRICQLVQGMPLGIVLAAAWVGMLSPREIAAEIGQSLDVLETEMRDVPERQRSIRAAFLHSWKLLTEDQRDVFRRLSVFRGGCTRQAAKEVAGASLRALAALVNKSLLRYDMNTERYDVHELLRQYAAEQLEACGDNRVAHDAHGMFYLNVLHEYEADLKGRRQLGALRDIEVDFENVSAAWRWAANQKNYEAVGRALQSLYLFCEMRNRFQEHEELFGLAARQLAPEVGEDPHAVWGRLLARQKIIRTLIPPEEFREQAQQSLAIAQRYTDRAEIAFSLKILGWNVSVSEGDYSKAASLFEESLAIAHALDNRYEIGNNLYLLGYAWGYMGQIENAVDVTQKCLDLRRQIGDMAGIAAALSNLGLIALFVGNYSDAEDLLEQADTALIEVGDQARATECHGALGLTAVLQGSFENAMRFAEETIDHAITNHWDIGRGMALSVVGVLANVDQNYATSLRLSSEGRQFIYVSGSYQAKISEWAISAAACGLGGYAQARQHVQITLKFARNAHIPGIILWCFPVYAILCANEGQMERAAELLSLAFSHPASIPGLLGKWPMISDLRADLETKLGAEVYAAAWERGKTLDLETVAAALLDAFDDASPEPDH